MKIRNFILIIIAVLILIPFLGRFGWLLKKGKKMEIMIINKSVQDESQNEVKTLNYVLNMHKIVKSTGHYYDYSRDYYGYHPEAHTSEYKIQSFRLDELAGIKEKFDAIYFADNGGVNLEGKNIANYSGIYGGFNQNDYLLLKNMLNSNKLIVAEFNFFSLPTQELVRYNTEQLIDIYSIGWKGKFFKDLQAKKVINELESKWLDIYKDYYNENWSFNGSGLIFLNEGQKRIVVLPSNLYMTAKYPVVNSNPDMSEKYNIPSEVCFTAWFDVVYPGKNQVISNFNMKLNEDGKDLLARNGLESQFPAVIKSQNGNLFLLTGDFSKQKFTYGYSRISGINNIVQSLSKASVNKPSRFIHTYYEPLISTIFLDYYDHMNMDH